MEFTFINYVSKQYPKSVAAMHVDWSVPEKEMLDNMTHSTTTITTGILEQEELWKLETTVFYEEYVVEQPEESIEEIPFEGSERKTEYTTKETENPLLKSHLSKKGETIIKKTWYKKLWINVLRLFNKIFK